MSKIGINDIVKAYHGSAEVSKIYLGTTVVYEAGGGALPDYLCFTANQAGSTVGIQNSSSNNPNIEYSTDGRTWNTLANNTPITLTNAEDKMYVRGNNPNGISSNSWSNYTKFTMTGQIAASGNIMSLIDADDFENITTIPNNYCFYNLFNGCTGLVSAANLELPATTLTRECYKFMFYNCGSLTTAPSLPATSLTNYCYGYMFAGCTSLTAAPSLPATTLADNCYYAMFNSTNVLPDCSNIDFTSDSVVVSGGLKGLFYGTKVTDSDLDTILPHDANNKYCLPAATARGCYSYMFNGCRSLTTAPQLPATSVNYESYYHMFEFCSSLTSVPIIPATTVGFSSCRNMFSNCTSLVTVPNNMLPATALTDYCYQDMFNGCTSLTTAPALPATTLTRECYSGMFTGCRSLTTAPSTLPATNLSGANRCYYSMFQGCTSLTTVSSNMLPATTLAESCYYYMFRNCTSLTTAPTLPATTLANDCYRFMFADCTGLTTAPALPATALTDRCYGFMFYNCTSLTTAPTTLPATTVASLCYQSMFENCRALTSVPSVLPATTLVNDCYGGMFLGCTALTTAPELPATALVSHCYDSMFKNCTNLRYIKAMFTTTPSSNYTTNWVSGIETLSGRFVMNSAATWSPDDYRGQAYGIPQNWVVEDENGNELSRPDWVD